ncbi:MAG: thymidylate synthase [Verrucomicrobiia bacterium]
MKDGGVLSGWQCFKTANDAFLHLLQELWRNGASCCPRGQYTREQLGVSFRLLNPRARLITNPQRRWSLPLALGEFCWNSRGDISVAPLMYYSKTWQRLVGNRRTILGSCYGRQMFAGRGKVQSQWECVRKELQRDSDSRRAVLVFGKELHRWGTNPVDVPCVTCAQFILRNGTLNCIVTMRSNDIMWGLGYDVFLFTMLQERMAAELGVDLGWYQHNAASMHLYERHFDMAKRVLAQRAKVSMQCEMPKMNARHGFEAFLLREKQIRLGKIPLRRVLDEPLEEYWRQLALVLLDFRLYKTNKTELESEITSQLRRPYRQFARCLHEKRLI